MRIGSLFSGYGGLDIAAQAIYGGQLAWYAEIEPAACKVLAAHHPGVPNLGDVKTINWSKVEPVDILTGGYPCQPFSAAGKRKGTEDERHLWPYVADAIRALRPRITILENVRGHVSLGFDTVLADLAAMGLSARWGVVRASEAGAPHGRARIFIIVTDPDREGSQGLGARPEDAERAWARGVAAGNSGELPAYSDRCRWNEDEQQSSDERTAQGERQSGYPHGHCSDGSTADADRAGSQARRHTGHDGERVRVELVGHPDAAADPDGDGHGIELHAGGMGGVECPNTEIGQRRREADRAWPQPDARIDWGKYGAAITRWERVTRPAPAPTIPGVNGRPRLSPIFVEWMMGLPEGHVTGHGLSAAQALKMLGNGVVPQQAILALKMIGGER